MHGLCLIHLCVHSDQQLGAVQRIFHKGRREGRQEGREGAGMKQAGQHAILVLVHFISLSGPVSGQASLAN